MARAKISYPLDPSAQVIRRCIRELSPAEKKKLRRGACGDLTGADPTRGLTVAFAAYTRSTGKSGTAQDRPELPPVGRAPPQGPESASKGYKAGVYSALCVGVLRSAKKSGSGPCTALLFAAREQRAEG